MDDATRVVLTSLEDDKAEDILAIDIRGKSSFADMLIVASGRSARHVGALADHDVPLPILRAASRAMSTIP